MDKDTFGGEPPVAKEVPKVVTKRPRVIIVDEPVERSIQVLYSTVIFRPGQVLQGDHQIQLAEEHGILIRERK
jgi:hypothetical protein